MKTTTTLNDALVELKDTTIYNPKNDGFNYQAINLIYNRNTALGEEVMDGIHSKVCNGTIKGKEFVEYLWAKNDGYFARHEKVYGLIFLDGVIYSAFSENEEPFTKELEELAQEKNSQPLIYTR